MWWHPAHFLAESRVRIAKEIAVEEVKFDGAIRIRVRDLEDFPADADADAQFFVNLTPEAAFVSFAGLAFAAGELPEVLEVNTAGPSSDQISFRTPYDRSGHDDRPWLRTHRFVRFQG